MGGDNPLAPLTNKLLSKSHQSDLDSYLSKRRNTTGSISLNKIIDLKNTSSGNTLKTGTTFNNSNTKLSTESKYLIIIFK